MNPCDSHVDHGDQSPRVQRNRFIVGAILIIMVDRTWWSFTIVYRKKNICVLYVTNMEDRVNLERIIGIGSQRPISGPWRLTVWDSVRTGVDSGKIYVFSEEHENDGSCPHERHFSKVAMDILQNTRGVHVLVENFIHANDIQQPRGNNTTTSTACKAVDKGILNNLRECLEVMKLNDRYCQGGCSNRIHFIDPRVDMVSVLPDGKLFQAISHHTDNLASKGDFDGAVLTVYEALVHPLSSLLPDKRNLRGRLVGTFEALRAKMTDRQGETFDRLWTSEITGGITQINKRYLELQKGFSGSNRRHSKKKFSNKVEEIKKLYKIFTNKFLDVWLLAHVFMIQNLPSSNGMVMYLGSLHGLVIEKFLAGHGFVRTDIIENTSLDSCLRV